MEMGRKKTAPRRIGFYALSVLLHAGLLGGAVFLAGGDPPAVREPLLQVRLSREGSASAAPEKTVSAPPVPPRAARRAPEASRTPAAPQAPETLRLPAGASAKPAPKRSRPLRKKTRPRTPPPQAAKAPSPPPVREVASLYPAAGEAAEPPPARPSPERKRPAAPPQEIAKRSGERKRKAPAPPAPVTTARLPSGPSAPPAAAPEPEDSRRILLQIADRIRKARRYPAAARRMGIEGIAVVSFRIRPGGGVLDLKVRQSSGHPLLDGASLDAVRRAAPLPYLRHALVIPIRYTLREADD